MDGNTISTVRRGLIALALMTALIGVISDPALAWRDDDQTEYGSDLNEDCDESEIPGPTKACSESTEEISIREDSGSAMTAPSEHEDNLSACRGLAEEMAKWHMSKNKYGVATKWHAIAAYGNCVRQNQDAD